MIKIGIAEDNIFLAQSLINKLGLFDDCKIKFHALNGHDLISQLNKDSNIDLIFMDIQMPKMNGIEATEQVTTNFPQIKVIMLTIYDAEQEIFQSLQAGATGYLLKESNPDQLRKAIDEALNGGAPMSTTIAKKAIEIIRNPDVLKAKEKDFGLTKREIEILTQLCKGLNYQEIASNLIISPNTVRRHTENVYKKLEVSNKASAIRIAYQYNLV